MMWIRHIEFKQAAVYAHTPDSNPPLQPWEVPWAQSTRFCSENSRQV